MKNQCFIIAFVFAALCTMSAFGYQTEYQPNSGSQHAFMEKSDVAALNSELLSNDGAVQISRVLNGLLKSDVAQKGKASSKKAEAAKYYKQALNLFDDEEYEEALDFINKALQRDPNNRKYEKVKKDIEGAIEEAEQQEDEADELADSAKNLLKKEKFDEALRAIDKALKMFPDNRNYKRIKEKIEDAKESYEEQEHQEAAGELLNQAQDLLNRQKFDEALKKVDDAEDVYPDDKSKYTSIRRKIKNAQSDYEEQNTLEEAANLAENALECLKQNRVDEALITIEDALAIDPGNSEYKKIKEKIELAKNPFSTTGKEAGARAVKEINGVEFAFRWCPAGTFMMKENTILIGRENNRQVTLTKGFWMMETEVTVGMFRAFVNATNYNYWKTDENKSWLNPGFTQSDSDPVTFVDRNDAVAFCKWASQQSGLDFRIPTIAQSLYASLAGTSQTQASNPGEIAWYSENSGGKTHPVSTKKPNAWGLYDLCGNVDEWCDWYYDIPHGNLVDPEGRTPNQMEPFHRGGSFLDNADHFYSPTFPICYPKESYSRMGFRCLVMPRQGN